MTRCVIDASVVLKWFLQDESDGAPALAVFERYMSGSLDLIAPALLEFETINGLRIAGKRGRISPEGIRTAAQAFLELGIRFVPLSFYMAKALAFADKYDLSIYDAAYPALAVETKTELISADEKLLKAASDADGRARPLKYFSR